MASDIIEMIKAYRDHQTLPLLKVKSQSSLMANFGMGKTGLTGSNALNVIVSIGSKKLKRIWPAINEMIYNFVKPVGYLYIFGKSRF